MAEYRYKEVKESKNKRSLVSATDIVCNMLVRRYGGHMNVEIREWVRETVEKLEWKYKNRDFS